MSATVASLAATADTLDRHVEFLLRELRPAGLDELGLAAVLRNTIADGSATFGIPAEFRATGLLRKRLAADVETHIFRIAQEALNNVHKHAKATSVTVHLERRADATTLVVTDDGLGFEAHGPARRSQGRRGLGLLGMHERAALIGGELRVDSAAGRGTTVRLRLPQPPPPDGPAPPGLS